MEDCAKIGTRLPVLPLVVPDTPEILEIERLIEDCCRAEGTAREDALDALANRLQADIRLYAHLLLATRFARFRSQPCFLALAAYGYFLLDRTDDALALALALLEGGTAWGFLFDLVSRILALEGRPGDAAALLDGHPEALAERKNLMARLAGLWFVVGERERADALAMRLTGLCPPAILERERAGHVKSLELLRRWSADVELAPGEMPSLPEGHRFLEEGKQRSWHAYAARYEATSTRNQDEVRFVAAVVRGELRAMLASGADIRTVINFGSLFGAMEYELAEEFRQCRIVGFDMAEPICRLNEGRFRAPNLEYAWGDFAPVARRVAEPGRTLVVHTRTAIFLYPAEMARLYATCRAAGVAWILGAEEVNFSVVSGCYPRFAPPAVPSLPLAGNLLMHDYAWYLDRAGYRMEGLCRLLYPVHRAERFFNADSQALEVFHARLATPARLP